MEHVDPRQLKPPQPSGPDRLRCDWERLSAIAHEVAPLARRHYAEMVDHLFDPNWDELFALERMGVLGVWTARTVDRTLVGYTFCFWRNWLWSREVRYCCIDACYLAPEWRGDLGYRYVKSIVAAVGRIEPGARVRWETNDMFEPDAHGRSRLAKLLERFNFRQVGTVMRK